MIKKTVSGWLVDIQPTGRGGKRYRKTLATKSEALRWEAWLIAKVTKAPDWTPPRKDIRHLSDLIDLWFDSHGQQLRDSKHRRQILLNLAEQIGNPLAREFNAAQFTEYRARRLKNGIKESTANREHAYLRSMFNELERLGHWQGENPLKAVRQFKERQQELIYLKPKHIEDLLKSLEGDTRLVTKICLATGARWSEAERLRAEQVSDGLITFTDTKSGLNRSVPISQELAKEIKRKDNGRLFKGCYEQFRRTISKLSIDLPAGQLTHVLRHTFASHFMANGGNILVLQRILGHQSLAMTMRYAHLAPEHLQEAIRLNPLSSVDNLLTLKDQKDLKKPSSL